jgi:predicted P-loop ATPase
MAAATKLVNSKISYYNNTYDTANDKEIVLDEFLADILSGAYQDEVLAVRNEKDVEKRKALKKKLPCVAISGSFKERKDSGLRSHSGYLSIDLDGLGDNVNGIKNILIKDPYVYAAFVSVSGNGLCLIFIIEGERHSDAFESISKYLYDNYQVIVDTSGRNISRLRYVSYDPHLYSSGAPVVFKKYLPKEKPKPVNKVVFVETEFDAIINEFSERGINICEDYRDWVSIGYAIASKFGLGGSHYFHTLSSQSSKYDPGNCDKLYNSIVKTLSDGKLRKSSVSTIYYFAKQNGIQTYSAVTQEIIKTTTTLKRSGMGAEAIAKNLEEFEGLVVEETIDIIRQAIENKVEIEDGGSIIEDVERWLQYNCKLKRNSITRMIENDGVTLDSTGFNTIFIAAKKVIDKLDYNLFERIILSNNTPTYNPLLDWFKSYEGREPTGVIAELAKTIETHNSEFAELFIRNWLVGLISSIHGQHSPLMLILAGEKQNTGKTQWFRRLMPKELSEKYYAESKLDAGKDDEILMTQKIIIMDDEMGGKSKTESKRLKDLTSKQMFYLREPYGRGNVNLQRLAVLCGTTNDLNILNDPTGNRRLIPIEVLSINRDAYNKIDKVDLMMEAYNLYKSGYVWELTDKEISILNDNTTQMQAFSIEYELILRYLRLPDTSLQGTEMSGTEIKVYLESWSNQRIVVNKLGQELKALGFDQRITKIGGKAKRTYRVVLVESERRHSMQSTAETPDLLPEPPKVDKNSPF